MPKHVKQEVVHIGEGDNDIDLLVQLLKESVLPQMVYDLEEAEKIGSTEAAGAVVVFCKGKGKRGGRKGSAKPWSSLQPDKPPAPWLPTEVEAAVMASVRLKNGVSLLLDTGSPGNLCSDEWSREMATQSIKVNRTPEYAKRDRTLTCRGVGTGLSLRTGTYVTR